MRKLLLVIGVFLCLSLTATAQDATAAFDASSPASDPAATPPYFSPTERQPWQLEAGAQYQQFNVFGMGFHDFGFNSSLTGYLNNWFGLEAAAEMGWGHTGTTPSIPSSLVANSFFVGVGPHLALSNKSRFEPWVHGLVGLQHFRFTQTNDQIGLGSNSALGYQVGGGVDLKLAEGAYWRLQGDYVGSNFSSSLQSNFSFGTGLVINF